MRSLGTLGFAAFAFVAACTNAAPPAAAVGSQPDAAVPVPVPVPRLQPGLQSDGSSDAGPTTAALSAAAGGPDAAAPSDEAPPHVKLTTIGMHVGGGPYDEITKEPIKRSVEPHFAELARCWKHVANKQPTDVGVDLVIEAGGGHARVSNPRSIAVGEGFVPCVVGFFEGVDFQRPRNGKTVVSYSVRFTP